MIIDQLLLFSDKQALNGTAAIPATNVIDLTCSVPREVGYGQDLWVVARFASITAGATVMIELQASDSPTSGFTTIQATGAVPAAVAAKGIAFGLTPTNRQRYLRARFSLSGASPAAVVTSWLTSEEPEAWAALAKQSNS